MKKLSDKQIENANLEKENLIKKFAEILKDHISDAEEFKVFLRPWLEFSVFMRGQSTWNTSWIKKITKMREIITEKGDKDLTRNFSTIADSFLESMYLGQMHSLAYEQLRAMKDKINDLLEDSL